MLNYLPIVNARNVKNLRIIRVLLGRPNGGLTKYELAKRAGCSKSWVIEFLKKIEAKHLARGTGVLDFDGLVDYYIKIAPGNVYFDFFVQDPTRFLRESGLDYALTTYGAENYVGHHLFPSRYDVYVKRGDVDKWKALVVSGGGLFGKGNLRLIMANDEAVFGETINVSGIDVASMPQLLIDLRREGGVCMEAYNLLVARANKNV